MITQTFVLEALPNVSYLRLLKEECSYKVYHRSTAMITQTFVLEVLPNVSYLRLICCRVPAIKLAIRYRTQCLRHRVYM
jgi:hypothetical protein